MLNFFHIPISFWKDEKILEYKKKFNFFCIVRNPYDRIVSDFKFWIKFYQDNRQREDLKKFFKYAMIEIEDIYENNFEVSANQLNKFVKKMLTNKKYYYSLDCHTIPQYKHIYTKINDKILKITDNVLRFENLYKDLIKFKKVHAPLINDNDIVNVNIHKTNSSFDKKMLNIESIQLINNYYKKDFELLGYTKIENTFS